MATEMRHQQQIVFTNALKTHSTVLTLKIALLIAILNEASSIDKNEIDETHPLTLSFCQLIVSLLLQLIMNAEVSKSFTMMKYTTNHWWKFKHAKVAFVTSLLQVISAVFTTAVIYTAVIIPATSVQELIRDFVTLLIIFKFDLLLAYVNTDNTIHTEQGKINFDKLFKIETSTSSKIPAG